MLKLYVSSTAKITKKILDFIIIHGQVITDRACLAITIIIRLKRHPPSMLAIHQCRLWRTFCVCGPLTNFGHQLINYQQPNSSIPSASPLALPLSSDDMNMINLHGSHKHLSRYFELTFQALCILEGATWMKGVVLCSLSVICGLNTNSGAPVICGLNSAPCTLLVHWYTVHCTVYQCTNRPVHPVQ